MDVVTGVKVVCADGPCGRSRYVILNPKNATITHVVVAEEEMFVGTRLVPIDYVLESSPEVIRLNCPRGDIEALPRFSEYEYAGPEGLPLAYSPAELWMGPLAAYWPLLLPEEHQHVPEGELSIRRGAHVEATDGHVGSVDGFLVEPVSGHITHLVLREGHLWDRRDVVIPASEIDRIEPDTVFLKMDKERVGTLPPFKPGSKGAALPETSALHIGDAMADAAGSPDPIQKLVANLASGERRIREEARHSLVGIGRPAVKALAAALTHGESRVRWEAAKALEQIADPASAPAMVAALEDEDPGVQWIAAEGLAVLGRDGVVPLLKALNARLDSAWLRRGAHHVLTCLADADLKRQLESVLAALEGEEPMLEVPVAAHQALLALEG